MNREAVMPKHKNHRTLITAATGSCLAIAMFACHSGSNEPPTASATTDSPTTRPAMANIFGPVPDKGGAQLWAENCTRCHNAPPPDRYSDAQWDVIVQHMRLRANLTGAEAREIAAFLKDSN
jgi:hypothetical protein